MADRARRFIVVTIIDYDAGNLHSVQNALARLGEEGVVTRDEKTILSSDRVILPGVGAFGDAMRLLESYGLVDVIHQVVQRQIPLIGICLGMQVLFEESEESPDVKGLGLLKGKIRRIPDQGGTLKVPHMGWNDLAFPNRGDLFEGIREGSFVYFVHSYYLKAEDPSIVTARTQYGVSIDASVQKGNLFGCQFHPEKSSDTGLQILKNFLDFSPASCAAHN